MTMFKRLKKAWQNYWDGETVPMFETEKGSTPPRTTLGRRNPYRELTDPFVRGARTYVLPGAGALPPASAPAVRPYEADVPDWARTMLSEMDQAVGIVITEELTEVRTPQFIRRTRRNIMDSIREDSQTIEADEEAVPAVVQRILDRAHRASDTEITGMIPVITDASVEEEAYA